MALRRLARSRLARARLPFALIEPAPHLRVAHEIEELAHLGRQIVGGRGGRRRRRRGILLGASRKGEKNEGGKEREEDWRPPAHRVRHALKALREMAKPRRSPGDQK